MLGFFRKKNRLSEMNKTLIGLSPMDTSSAFTNVWRRLEDIENRQRLIMNHLGIRIDSSPRVVKMGDEKNIPGGIQTASEQLSRD